jgi:Asp-tRNA(Asn)/Glu-tRNA(Gln) amidotransferase A subunit family amidase
MAAAFRDALDLMASCGAAIVEVKLPSFTKLKAVLHAIAGPELFDVHRRLLKTCPELYSPEVKALILGGALVPGPAYVQALRVKQRVTNQLAGILRTHDVIAMPVVPMPAWDVGSEKTNIGAREYNVFEAMTLYCPMANLAGLPAVSIPCGFTTSKLPLAFQMIGRSRGDDELLQLGAAYQEMTSWHDERPT